MQRNPQKIKEKSIQNPHQNPLEADIHASTGVVSITTALSKINTQPQSRPHAATATPRPKTHSHKSKPHTHTTTATTHPPTTTMQRNPQKIKEKSIQNPHQNSSEANLQASTGVVSITTTPSKINTQPQPQPHAATAPP